MSKPCDPRRRGWLAAACALLLAAPLARAAAAPQVEAFDAQTWQREFTAPSRPTVVVFSTTDCTHCPRVLAQLADVTHQRGLRATLAAVVVDELAPEDADGRAHYRRADRLMVFDGPAAQLRHTVNPGWRGVTPYVAFLLPGQAPVFVAGPPAAERIESWAAAARAATAPAALVEKHR